MALQPAEGWVPMTLKFCPYDQRNVNTEHSWNLAVLIVLLILFTLIGLIYMALKWKERCPLCKQPIERLMPAAVYGAVPMPAYGYGYPAVGYGQAGYAQAGYGQPQYGQAAQASGSAAAASSSSAQSTPCTACGAPLTWYAQYNRWYCNAESRWL
jgi:hypothetical protein